MRFREVFQFELEHILRSAATWVYAVLLCLIAAFMLLATHDGDILFNAPIRLTWMAVAAALFGLLMTAGLFSSVAVRDVEAGTDQLLYTTPLTKTEYLAGRFLAALVVNAVLLLVIPLGQTVVTLLHPGIEPELIGPFRIAVYVQTFSLFLIPALLFSSGLLFTIAMLFRHVIPVYVGAIVLVIGGIVAGNFANRIDSPILRALADVFAVATLDGTSSSWTPVEQNTRLFGFPAPLVWSRIFLVVLAAAALALLHWRFRFAHDDGGGRRRERRSIAAPLSERAVPVTIPRADGTFGRSTWLWQTLAVARRGFAEVTASRVFVVVLLLAFGLTLLWGWNVAGTAFDTPVWPVTHLVATEALSQRNAILIYLIIALYSGEMVWKDRDVGMAEIADAAPVSEGITLLGRYLALVATLALMMIAILAAGLTIQALQGYYDFEFGLYFRILFGIHLAFYALLAALAMTLHVVVNQKYVGHILMVTVVLVFISGEFSDHNLLSFGGDPGWTYSEMNGFGPFTGPLVWFKLYWAAWALLLAVMASMLWVRGRERGVKSRLRVAGARFRGATARTAALAIALVLMFGGFIFYNTNILNEYRKPNERGAPQAEYEKRYKRFENAPQPTIVSAQLRAEIYPENRAADITGTFRLMNRTGAAIDSVHIYLPHEVDTRTISFDRTAEPVLVDDDAGFRIYALERALEPGDSLQLSFDVSWRPRGFPNSGVPTDVVENGSLFSRYWLPMIGYQPMFELSGDRERSRFGLGPRPLLPAMTDSTALLYRHLLRNEDYVRVETILGTAEDQIALTPGYLRRSWKENGRSYFQYDTEVPESFGAAIFSGRYAVREDRWKDVELRIYHHPAHAGNLDRAMRGMKAALEYFTEQFGPVPRRQLSIVEIPPYGSFGSAHPGLIAFSETFFGIRADEGDVDEPFYGTAHEVAHHWWGGQVRSATVPGASFLSESLANYSAMILTEKTFGPEMARRVYDAQMSRYIRGRGEQSKELPVLHVRDQPYIAYRKGAVALFILRDHIGEHQVNTALRRYAEKYRGAGPPFPTSRDLYAELRTVTPDSLHSLLADLFETMTLWDVRTEQATVERTANGGYDVMLEVVARKVRSDNVGRETEVPMNDLVEIGVFAEEGSKPLYLERRRIRTGSQTIRITVPREPARAGIDPWYKLFDRQRDDNVVDVRASAAFRAESRGGR